MKKILIADDEPEILKLIRRALELEDENYELHEAKNGDEALAKAIEIKPDLLLLDIMMPGMSGYEVCRELKNNPDTKGIIIIFVTARGASDIAESTMKMRGGDGFIPKPFSMDVLAFKIKQILKQHEQGKELF